MKPYLLYLLIIIGFCSPAWSEKRLHVIDVGYGQAIHLNLEDNHYLFDTGRSESFPLLMQHFANQGITRLAGIFLSHTHVDHVGSLLSIVTQIKTDKIFWNEQYPPNEKTVSELEKTQKWVPFHVLNPGDSLKLSKDVSLRVLNSTLKTENLNENSLVFGITYKKIKILIPGDAEWERQKNLVSLESEWLADVDFLIWPHHGDKLFDPFLKMLKNVKTCVVSVGENEYELPKPELESQAKKLCRQLYRTDKNGTVSFNIKKRKMIFDKNDRNFNIE